MAPQTYSLTSSDETPTRKCKHSECSLSWSSFIKAWWYLPAHLLWSIAVLVVFLRLLNHQPFPVHDTPHYLLTQSDVSTLVSIGLKLTNFVCTSLQGILAWRCAFIALERKGLTFSQLSKQLTYKVMLFVPRSRLIAWISISMILAMPAQLAGPILSGAITWVPYRGLQAQQGTPVGISTPFFYSDDWGDMLVLNVGRQAPGNQVLRGTGATVANIAATKLHGNEVVERPRRMVPELRSVPVGSLLGNITMPYLRISEFAWLNALESVPQDIKHAVEDKESDWFNYSRRMNPLYSFPGDVSLTHKNEFSGFHARTLPKPNAVSAQTYIALYAFTHNTTEDGRKRCSFNANHRLAQPPVQEYLHMEPFPDRRYISYCYAIASVTFEAGVIQCKDSAVMVAESLAECQRQELSGPEPDPLVEFSLALVPETILQVVSMNNTGWDFRNGSESYVKNMLHLAFQGAWSAATYYLNRGQERLPTVEYERISAVRAEIKIWRV